MNQFRSYSNSRKVWAEVFWRVAVVVGLTTAWSLVLNRSLGGSESVLRPQFEGDSTPLADSAAIGALSDEPATVEFAARVLDLRKFPVMEGARVFGDKRTLGMLMYEVQGDTESTFVFQRKQLQERGWKELPGTHLDTTSASGKFTKDGFLVVASTWSISSDSNKVDWTSVTLVNHGNVRAEKLPVPPGVSPFQPDVMDGSYTTDATVHETAEACRKLLLFAGWPPTPAMSGLRSSIRRLLK